jgi:hypothetical protein
MNSRLHPQKKTKTFILNKFLMILNKIMNNNRLLKKLKNKNKIKGPLIIIVKKVSMMMKIFTFLLLQAYVRILLI